MFNWQNLNYIWNSSFRGVQEIQLLVLVVQKVQEGTLKGNWNKFWMNKSSVYATEHPFDYSVSVPYPFHFFPYLNFQATVAVNSVLSPKIMQPLLIKTKAHSPFPQKVKPKFYRSRHYLQCSSQTLSWDLAHSGVKQLLSFPREWGSGRQAELFSDQEDNSSALRSSHPYFFILFSLYQQIPSVSRHSTYHFS